MDKNLILLFFNFLFVYLNQVVYSLEADQLKDLLPYRLDDANKNLKLKISLDSIKLKISDSLFLECPLGKLKPATFMFLTRESVDFISRFSIQLNETFRKNNVTSDLSELLNQQRNSDDNQSNLINQKRKGKIKLTCKWSSIDLNREIANLTLFLNKPKDNSDFNTHLLKYFDSKQDQTPDLPEIVNRSINSKPMKKEIGDKVTFFCKVRNQQNLQINWFKKTDDGQLINLNEELLTNRNALDMSNYVIRAGRLSINELSNDDFGEFVCRVSNDHGEDYAFYKLEMIESKDARLPKIDSFEDLDLYENKSVLLNCSITSYDKFGIQWFEYVDCKKSDCKNQKYDYNYFFILENEYYKPIDTSKFNLIPYNKIHYLSTYFINKSDLIDTNKYICMVRNENGLNYKMMTLTVNKMNRMHSKSSSSTMKLEDYYLLLITVLSVVVLVLMAILFLIFFKLNKLKKKTPADKEVPMPNNLVNNFSKDSFKNKLSASDYYSKNNAHLFVPLNKQFNNKSLKNLHLINNLVETGRNSNLLSSNYSFQCLNKDNRSKLSSVANSTNRLNNTPVQGETFNVFS